MGICKLIANDFEREVRRLSLTVPSAVSLWSGALHLRRATAGFVPDPALRQE